MRKRVAPRKHTEPDRVTARSGKRVRRVAAARIEFAPAPQRRAGRSRVMQLAAEVERLERELAAARAQVAELAARAEIDPLTEILNRRGLERELKRALAYVKRHGTGAALIYFDLDRFKSINDRHGHTAGDAVLKAVASAIAQNVRTSDVVARLGGDEFAVLLWNLSEASAVAKAQALEAAISGIAPTHAGATIKVQASAGLSMLLPLDEPSQVLGRADRAMYARKSKARKSLARIL